jgi:hypothetical protein
MRTSISIVGEGDLERRLRSTTLVFVLEIGNKVQLWCVHREEYEMVS